MWNNSGNPTGMGGAGVRHHLHDPEDPTMMLLEHASPHYNSSVPTYGTPPFYPPTTLQPPPQPSSHPPFNFDYPPAPNHHPYYDYSSNPVTSQMPPPPPPPSSHNHSLSAAVAATAVVAQVAAAARMQQTIMDLDMITAAAALQQQQIEMDRTLQHKQYDLDRTRAAIAAATAVAVAQQQQQVFMGGKRDTGDFSRPLLTPSSNHFHFRNNDDDSTSGNMNTNSKIGVGMDQSEVMGDILTRLESIHHPKSSQQPKSSSSSKKVSSEKKVTSETKAPPKSSSKSRAKKNMVPTSTATTSTTNTATSKKKSKVKTGDDVQSATNRMATTHTSNNASAKKLSSQSTKMKRNIPILSSPSPSAYLLLQTGIQPTLSDHVPNLTEAEYQNLDALMTQFCKLPYLSEFCRPLSLLHPDLEPIYTKVVRHPIDLGMVSRSIRKRLYKTGRAVCLDMWRIFGNCIKYHTHPMTRDVAMPSFVSIAMHLREYFTSLWLEYMIPSDTPVFSNIYYNEFDKMDQYDIRSGNDDNDIKSDGVDQKDIMHRRDPWTMALKNAFEKRDKERLIRLRALGSTTVLTSKAIEKVSDAILKLVESGGCVDALDQDLLISLDIQNSSGDEHKALEATFAVLRSLCEKLRQLASVPNKEEDTLNCAPAAPPSSEYSVDDLYRDLQTCYSQDVFEGLSYLRKKIRQRLDRLLGKFLVPINEINNRGVNQSSIWACMAAVIWARESTKRPFWPALVIGVLAPDDQKEEWHKLLTELNEARLPEKLRTELQTGKRKAEMAIKKQCLGASERMSYFLVEFLGSHEFIWIREADIIEKFNPEEDPNDEGSALATAGKRRKTSTRNQTPTSIKTFQKGVDEGRWAMEEFELQMNDPCGDSMEEDTDNNAEGHCSFPTLCESDSEADSANVEALKAGVADALPLLVNDSSHSSELEEFNELLATNGMVDSSADGRKNAKKRAALLKKFELEGRREILRKEKEEKVKQSAIKKVKEDEERKRSVGAVTTSNAVVKTKFHDQDPSKRINSDREEKELEKRRKKRERERERERGMKEQNRKSKKQRTTNGSIVRIGKRFGLVNKRGRATAIVRGYLHRLLKDGEVRNCLSLNGLTSLPIQDVDSSGLLGLTVAFRAAAEKIDTCNNCDNPSPCSEWDLIDADTPWSSVERCENLEKKIALLEKALLKLSEQDARRTQLIHKSLADRAIIDQKYETDEQAALVNDIPKRKIVIKKEA